MAATTGSSDFVPFSLFGVWIYVERGDMLKHLWILKVKIWDHDIHKAHVPSIPIALHVVSYTHVLTFFDLAKNPVSAIK
jgi:hypothetical protein